MAALEVPRPLRGPGGGHCNVANLVATSFVVIHHPFMPFADKGDSDDYPPYPRSQVVVFERAAMHIVYLYYDTDLKIISRQLCGAHLCDPVQGSHPSRGYRNRRYT